MMLTQRIATVPYYQPETSYEIFNRVMFNTDVATGKKSAIGYSTTGPSSAFTHSEVPAKEDQAQCYLWDVLETCTTVQKQILKNGSAIVQEFILVGYKQADGSKVFYNGTNGGGSGAGSGTKPSSAAPSMAASGTTGTFLLSAAVLVALQAALF
jgi:carboxypeptidase D